MNMNFMKIRRHDLWIAVLVGAILPLWGGASLFAADSGSDGEGVKKHGVVHNIAEDRRVEKVGGLYEPEGLDIYMKRHLDTLESQVRALEGKLETVNKKIDEVSGLIRALGERLGEASSKKIDSKRS